MLKGLIVAFSMYSRIPMPEIEFNKNNLRMALIFFPLVGLVLGIIIFFEALALKYLKVNEYLSSGLIIYTGFLVTGGIHLDGFIDAADAFYSWGDKKKKLEIMKDSHVGGFAVISFSIYLILVYSSIISMYKNYDFYLIIFLPALVRGMSGYSIASEKPAKENGLMYMFADVAEKSIVKKYLIAQFIILSALVIYIEREAGVINLRRKPTCLRVG